MFVRNNEVKRCFIQVTSFLFKDKRKKATLKKEENRKQLKGERKKLVSVRNDGVKKKRRFIQVTSFQYKDTQKGKARERYDKR